MNLDEVILILLSCAIKTPSHSSEDRVVLGNNKGHFHSKEATRDEGQG